MYDFAGLICLEVSFSQPSERRGREIRDERCEMRETGEERKEERGKKDEESKMRKKLENRRMKKLK